MILDRAPHSAWRATRSYTDAMHALLVRSMLLAVVVAATGACGSDAPTSPDAPRAPDATTSPDAPASIDAGLDAAPDAPVGPAMFTYTGAAELFTVPAGVTAVSIEALGAAGGDGYNADDPAATVKGLGGPGGSVTATLAVTPGQQLHIRVGGRGANATSAGPGAGGFNGGGAGADSMYNPMYFGAGGGGASDVRLAGDALADRIVVAGGGGGGSGWCTDNSGTGGAGGGLAAASGAQCTNIAVGTGGTQAAGGTLNGVLGLGGATELTASKAGAGGGGGYHGGGGSDGSGGGGGSSFAQAGATAVTHTQGGNAADGRVTISW